MDTLYIVMPAYNEEANVEAVVRQWYPILEDKSDASRMVIADSGSTDKTHEILLELKKSYMKLEILSETGKEHGPKLFALYDYAIKQSADYIFQTDSDGQTDPDEFTGFWEVRQKYDGIFGERISRGDGKMRDFIEKVVCILLKIYFGVKIPDANAPFRLMRTDVVKKYLYKLHDDYKLPNIMMTTYFKYYNEKVLFKEISFRPRAGGNNSVNIPSIIKIGWASLKDFRRLKRAM